MPRYTVSWPPEGYRFAQDHEGRWHIERHREDGLWEDFAGPYKQRGSANERMRRLSFARVNAARLRGDEVYGTFDAIRDRLLRGVRSGVDADTSGVVKDALS